MNVSMNDTFNLGWKLAHVLQRVARPQILHTYSAERQAIAQALIDFDRTMSRMFAAKPKVGADHVTDPDHVDPAVFQEHFQKSGRFTAGVETRYLLGLLTRGDSDGDAYQHLAAGFEVGTRFQSVQVLRAADAKPVQLGHVMKADGRWRIVIFGDESHGPTDAGSPVAHLCEFLEKSLVPLFTPAGADVDAIFDVRAVFPQSRQTFEVTELPSLLLPHTGKLGLQDYEKVFTDEESYGFGFGNIFKARGVDRQSGCVVVVRPDQYISAVLPLSSHGHRLLQDFFEGFMIRVDQRVNGQVNGTRL
jgi:phenol 2-monooxygenase